MRLNPLISLCGCWPAYASSQGKFLLCELCTWEQPPVDMKIFRTLLILIVIVQCQMGFLQPVWLCSWSEILVNVTRFLNECCICSVWQVCDTPDEAYPAWTCQRNLPQAAGGRAREEGQHLPRGLSPPSMSSHSANVKREERRLIVLIILSFVWLQASALERDILEVDPNTKEMLKMMVRLNLCFLLLWLNLGWWDN